MQSEIKQIEGQIQEIEGQIQEVEEQILVVEKLEQDEPEIFGAVARFLLDKKTQLRNKTKRLRDEQLMLLRTANSAGIGLCPLDSQVVFLLEQSYGAQFLHHIQDQSSIAKGRKRPIKANSNDIVDDVGSLLMLEGYEELALRGLVGLMVLQSRSERLKLTGGLFRENQDDKFQDGTQILRIVGGPGTGKTTSLTQLWRYIYDHLDELIDKLPGTRPDAVNVIRERVRNSLRSELFLVFTFSNADLTCCLEEEGRNFMATRMLYAMVANKELVSDYRTFLQQMDPTLHEYLKPRHLLQFVQGAIGIGQKRGLVVFNFDECNVPQPPDYPSNRTYFQEGLSELVWWRKEEAFERFKSGAEARDLLPVIQVISGTDCNRMTLLETSARNGRVYDLGGAVLRDDSLLRVAKDAITRIAQGTSREVPKSTDEALVTALCFAGADPRTTSKKQLHVARLWEFLQQPPNTRRDTVFDVVQKVQTDSKGSSWGEWLDKAEDKEKLAFLEQAFAHTIIGRPVARDARIAGTNRSWGDAERDGFIATTDEINETQVRGELRPALRDLRNSHASLLIGGRPAWYEDKDSVPAARSAWPFRLNLSAGVRAPDAFATTYVHIPPMLLRVMYQQLKVVWAKVRNLFQSPKSLEDKGQSDVGLLMLRLQLAREVFGERTLDLEELCPGLSFLGKVIIPTSDYTAHQINKDLETKDFIEECLKLATPSRQWAFTGPGNGGPHSWLILCESDFWEQVDAEQGDWTKVVLYVQSETRSSTHHPKGALNEEVGRCWDIPKDVDSCLLYFSDERAQVQHNEVLKVGSHTAVVTVTRDPRLISYGIALATMKRCHEVIEQLGHRKKK